MLALVDFFLYFLFYVLLTLPLGFSFLAFIAWKPLHSSSYLPMSVVLGSGAMTAFMFLTGHFIAIHFIHALMLSFLLTTLFLVCAQKKKDIPDISLNFKDYSCLFWALIILGLYVGLHFYQPFNHPRYYNLMPDYVKHDGVLWALDHKTLPPQNPFFHPGKDIPMSYYYLFHLLPASLPKINDDSYQHLFASIALWTGLIFLCCIYTWLREKNWELGKINYLILGLTLLGGLDIYSSYHILGSLFMGCQTTFLECWQADGNDLEHMFAGLMGSLVNAPQHIFSMAMGLAIIPLTDKSKPIWKYFLWIPVLGVFGSSVYLGLILMIIYLIYVYSAFDRIKPLLSTRAFWISACLILLSLATLAMEIAPSAGSANSGVSFKPFTMSPKIPFSWAERGMSLLRILTSMAPLLLMIFLQGFKRSIQCFTKLEVIAMFTLLGVSLLFCSNGPNNDLTMRGLFCVRVFLLIAAAYAYYVNSNRLSKNLILMVLIFVGMGTTLNNFIYRGPYRLWAQSSSSHTPLEYLESIEQIKSYCDAERMIQGNISRYSRLLMTSHRKVFYLDDSHSPLFNINPHLQNEIRSAILWATLNPKSIDSFKIFKKYNIGCLLLKKGTYQLAGNSPIALIFENSKYTVWKLP